jgi:hypothetical protein
LCRSHAANALVTHNAVDELRHLCNLYDIKKVQQQRQNNKSGCADLVWAFQSVVLWLMSLQKQDVSTSRQQTLRLLPALVLALFKRIV